MATVKYVGRYEAVELWCPDGRREIVERGKTLVTTKEHGDSLLSQDGEWQAGSAKKRKPRKQAPSVMPAESQEPPQTEE